MVKSRVRISTVRMQNFLSFYEGTVQLHPGITVIVGPNGSGKTSIFQAMKFALGSNQRDERYPKWSDFVRHGASAGEVELTVVNGRTEHKLLRKIDRDGIPRAYVDGKRVKAAELRRLVDSLDLDIDNTLVFMPQERINALREMNPVEVRRLVEEGTGLSALRDRISVQETQVIQCQHKLRAAQDESRVVERELELLKHDLERLQRKRELLSEEQSLNIEVKWANLDDLANRISETKKNIEEQESGLVEVLDEQRHLEREKAESEAEASRLEARIGSVQKELGAIDAKIDEQQKKAQRIEDNSKNTLSEIGQLEKELKSESRRAIKVRDEIERSQRTRDVQIEKKKVIDEELSEADKERSQLEDELAAFADWNAERSEVYGSYRALQAEFENKDLLYRSVKERLQVEEAELQSIDNKWAHVWKAMEGTDEKGLARKKGQLENEISALNESRFREAGRVTQLQKEIDELRIKLSESSQRIPEEVRNLKDAVVEHGLNSVDGPVVEMLIVKDDSSAAVEAVLTENMAFAFIVTDKAEFTLLKKLRDKAEAPSPIILVTSMESNNRTSKELPQGKEVEGWLWELIGSDEKRIELLKQAFGSIVYTQTVRAASRIAEAGRFGAVSKDGLFLTPRITSIVSHPKAKPSGLVSSAPIEKQLARRERELKISSQAMRDTLEKLDNLAAEREEIIDLQAQITRWSSTWDRRKKLLENVPELEERIANLDDELKTLQAEVGKAQRELRKLDGTQPPERSRLVGQRSALRMKIRRLQADLTKVDSSIQVSTKGETRLREELRQFEENEKMLSGRVRELREELKTSKGEIAAILEAIEELTEGRTETEATETKLRESLSNANASIRAVNERLIELNLRIKDSRLQVLQERKHLRNMEEEQDRLSSELGEQIRPSKVRSLETVRNDLIRVRHLLDDYQDVSESVSHSEVQLKSRLSELDEKVVEMSTELEEAEATVIHIREQYHNGMNATLSKLERQVNSILDSVDFSGVVRFDLSLRDGVYGVEFKSKIKSEDYGQISAGSGGERSLIAIGLILSLQRYNPAPTYALDEIDIFLDATNTEAVSKLLYDASRRSQFVLFTPAKSTHLLKHADKRIGVVSPGGVDPSVIIESPAFSGVSEVSS
ncbi:MAG: AAA family ATPase [Candidatus Hodarchaeota archaeon]